MFKQSTAYLNRYFIAMLLVLLTLSGCEITPRKALTESELINQELRAISSPKKVISKNSRLLKKAKTDKERAHLQLKIAEAQLELEQYRELKKTLLSINSGELAPADKVRLSLLQAEYLLVINQARAAVKRLPKNQSTFPFILQQRVLKTQSKVLLTAGYYLESIKANIRLSRLLNNLSDEEKDPLSVEADIEANAKEILQKLSKLPESTLNSTYEKQLSDELKTWIEFIYATRPHRFSLDRFDQAIASWRLRENHDIIPDSVVTWLRNGIQDKQTYPKKIALFLPLTGRFSSEASSVRDGVIAAYYTYAEADRPEVVVFDTADTSSTLLEKFLLAKDRECELVIGPLTKQSIAEIDSLPELPLPTLALNHIERMPKLVQYNEKDAEGTLDTDFPLYQFGLLPEDEAKQAARFALIRNQTNALVLVPDNNRGKRMADAFVNEYHKNGGHVLRVETYSPKAVDFGSPIKLSFNINQSHNRHSILQTVLARNVNFEPRVREDIDVIYAVTNPDQARSLRPQLKFHDVGDIPILASSHIYNGNNVKVNKDINDVVFTHMPWTLYGEKTALRKQINRVWPNKLLRQDALYALGADAFNIIPYLSRMESDPLFYRSGFTGNLSLDESNRVNRELVWAKFEEGLVVLEDISQYQVQLGLNSKTDKPNP